MLDKNFTRSPPWVESEIIAVTGPVSYKVHLDSGGIVCRQQQDQLRKGSPASAPVSDQETYDDFPITVHDNEGSSVDQTPQSL